VAQSTGVSITDAGVNVALAYLATNTRLVVAAVDLDQVRAVD
jgi:hypothetical protein